MMDLVPFEVGNEAQHLVEDGNDVFARFTCARWKVIAVVARSRIQELVECLQLVVLRS